VSVVRINLPQKNEVERGRWVHHGACGLHEQHTDVAAATKSAHLTLGRLTRVGQGG
jgi:hypothetical protein